MADRESDQLFRATGGSRSNGWNATWPFARLVITRDSIRIEGTVPIVRRITPTATIPLAELRQTERLRTMLNGAGLRFRAEGRAPIIFWHSDVGIARAAEVVEGLGIDVVDGGRVWF